MAAAISKVGHGGDGVINSPTDTGRGVVDNVVTVLMPEGDFEKKSSSHFIRLLFEQVGKQGAHFFRHIVTIPPLQGCASAGGWDRQTVEL